MSNPYQEFVSAFPRLLRQAMSLPLGQFSSPPRDEVAPSAARALFFSPHPDDECISGGVALRLLREARMRVINVAVTQGSKKERQAERLQELQAACRYIGFELQTTGPRGLEGINPKAKEQQSQHWSAAVSVIQRILEEHQPRILMFPHARDSNSTHIGTHLLVMEALTRMPGDFECFVFETEFWGAMDDPNLMLEMAPEDIADMIAALTFHVGEVNRNPYHLSLPGWMMDNVRRGGELVGGQGGAAPDFTFAALYRFRKWTSGKLVKLYEGGKILPRTTNVGSLLVGGPPPQGS